MFFSHAHLAATRHGVAIGREPVDRGLSKVVGPEGAKGNLSHVAPLGLRGRRWARDHGLTPMATTCRPAGTKTRA